MTDDSEIVRLSDRVMAGRHPLTDQARREEIRAGGGGRTRREAWQLCRPIWGDTGGVRGDVRRNRFRSAGAVAVSLVDDREAPRTC